MACLPGYDCLASVSCPAPEIECPAGFFCSRWNNKGLPEDDKLGKAIATATFGTSEQAETLIDNWRTSLPASRFHAGECMAGYLCSNSTSLQLCPAGKWCGELSWKPRDCDAPSSCASEGAKFQVTFALPILAALLSFLLLTAACYLRQTQKAKELASRKKQSAVPVKSMEASTTSLDTSLTSSPAAPAPTVTPPSPPSSLGSRGGVPFLVQGVYMQVQGRELLKDITLPEIKPGQLTVLMGPSGSGKTLLLNILRGTSSSIPGSSLRGTLSINGVPLDLSRRGTARHILTLLPPGVLGYVPKADVVDRAATVREALSFSARARLPDSVSPSAVHAIVDKTLSVLQLQGVADVVIGGSENVAPNISGGQLKRVNIGMELVAQPRVLLLDEPTAGLDASVSLDLLAALRTLAVETGITVVTVLHQPRSEAFALFHQVILLAQGCVAYAGAPSDAIPYFTGLTLPIPGGTGSGGRLGKYVYPGQGEEGAAGAEGKEDQELVVAKAMNPADWIVDIAAGLIQPTPLTEAGTLTVAAGKGGMVRGHALLIDLGEAWKSAKAGAESTASKAVEGTAPAAESKVSAEAADDDDEDDDLPAAQTSSMRVQLWVQVRRGLVTRLRDHGSIALFTLLHMFMAVALSSGFSIYIQGSYRNALDPPLSNRLKAYCPSVVMDSCERNAGDLGFQQLLFFMAFAIGSVSGQAAIGLFAMGGGGPALIRRECGDSGLSVLTFGIGRMLADLTTILWNTTLFAAVWMLMGHVGRWYYWWAVTVGTGFAASGLGYVASLLTRPVNAAVGVMIAMITQSVFSGVEPQLTLVNPLPIVNWAWYLSYAVWTAEATYVAWAEHMFMTETAHGSVQKGADWYGYDVSNGVGKAIGALFGIGLLWRAFALYLLWRTARPQASVLHEVMVHVRALQHRLQGGSGRK